MGDLTFRLFNCNFPLEKCLQKPVGDAKESLAVEHYKNRLQIRHVERRDENNVYGRLCKLRKEGKPTTGTENTLVEEIVEKDVIEAACFRYCVDTRLLIIQQNLSVATSLNGVFLKVLREVQKEAKQNYQITQDDHMQADLEDEALKKLVRDRHLINRMRVRLPKQSRVYMLLGDDSHLDADESYLTERENITIEMKISIGEAKAEPIKDIYRYFKQGKIENASFGIDGEPSFSLDSLLKRIKLSFENEKYGEAEEYKAIYDALETAPIPSE